jgi:hypothetical protein
VKWKPEWPEARENLVKWWRREGLALSLTAPRAQPIEPVPEPGPEPADLEVRWTDPRWRIAQAEFCMANRRYYAEAFACFEAQIGPGSLGTFIGARPRFAPETVWYDPCIADPDACGPIRFSPRNNKWLDVHMRLVEEGLRRSRGRYLVSLPDLIENIDTLAAMRGTQELLMDLVDRPAWVHRRLAEINEAFFAAFDLFYDKVRDADGGNAFIFSIWGPGRTCKVQCDFSCMVSARMFREFVAPHLSSQCQWLDYSLYHLDGTQAMHHLDALLEIEALDAIEWTPQAGMPGGGSPRWYDFYTAVRKGGKSVQAIGVAEDEVIPLLDAVGPQGLFIACSAKDETAAEKLLARVEQYR